MNEVLSEKKNLLKPIKSPFNRRRNSKEANDNQQPQDYTCRYEQIIHFSQFGNAITLEDAIDLKNLCWGSSTIVIPRGWQSGVKFNDPEEPTSYGLRVDDTSTKPFQMAVQGLFLKHLLFSDREKRKINVEAGAKKDKKMRQYMGDIMRPTATRQKEMFSCALTDLLWKLGDEKYAVFATQGPTLCFDPPLNYARDGVTEKLHVYRCKSKDELLEQIRKHFSAIVSPRKGGVACLLYSIVLSKGFYDLKYEMQDQNQKPLIETNGKMSFCLTNLMLAGCATPYLQNGVFTEGKFGVPDKTDVGMLVWYKDTQINRYLKVGSRLKNPSLPVWIICCDDNWGVLFSPNIDILNIRSIENRFTFHYYSASKKELHYKKETLVQVITRDSDYVPIITTPQLSDEDLQGEEENAVDLLKMAVQTRWDGAAIEWLSCSPYV